MAEANTLLAMFEDFEPASRGIEQLQQLGVRDDDMNVISGIPIKHSILGRPPAITYVAREAYVVHDSRLVIATFIGLKESLAIFEAVVATIGFPN